MRPGTRHTTNYMYPPPPYFGSQEYVALLEGHLDPSTLPLREEEDIYCGDKTETEGKGCYNVRASCVVGRGPGDRLRLVHCIFDTDILPHSHRRRREASLGSGSRSAAPTSSASSTSPPPLSTEVCTYVRMCLRRRRQNDSDPMSPQRTHPHTPDLRTTEKQLAAERRQKEQGEAALSPTEAALLATKWRDAREALPGKH